VSKKVAQSVDLDQVPKCWCGAPWGVCVYPWWCYGRKFNSRQRPGKRLYPPSPRTTGDAHVSAAAAALLAAAETDDDSEAAE
jgi:hypothetical protein